MAGLAHALQIHRDVVLGQQESAADPGARAEERHDLAFQLEQPGQPPLDRGDLGQKCVLEHRPGPLRRPTFYVL